MPRLHIFNPHHDLALANACPTFKAPESALLMAHDLGILPAWYANRGDIVISDLDKEDIDCQLFPSVNTIPRLSPIHDKYGEYKGIFPWGWDHCIVKYLEQCAVNKELMPSLEDIESIRKLSHRSLSTKAMEYLRTKLSHLYPQPAELLENIKDIKAFAAKHAEVVLKAPWSSSGKGIFWSKGELTSSIEGWCKRTIEKQGAVMGEIAYDKVQDFAMEFYCDNKGEVYFAGYSLFFTERAGIYHGNRLMSNEDIEQELSQWISVDYLHELQNTWIDFLKENVVTSYVGYLGVDMFVYRENKELKINPAVEINLRMTMGMVARIFYDRYMKEETKGWFTIEHLPPGQLYSKHLTNKEQQPIVLEENRIAKGYLSLCPITEETIYAATVIVEE